MKRSLTHFMSGIVGRKRSNEVTMLPLRKEDAPCCVSRRDENGRLPVGFCSPGCVRRHPFPPDEAA